MNPRTILIVEDQRNWRELLKVLLRHLDYDIEEVSNIDEAEAKLSELEFSLVITNLQLNAFSDIPDQLGLTVIDTLQTHSPKTPCIILTASNEEKQKQLETYCRKRHHKDVPVLLKDSPNLRSELKRVVTGSLKS